jgi:hypothetical protein
MFSSSSEMAQLVENLNTGVDVKCDLNSVLGAIKSALASLDGPGRTHHLAMMAWTTLLVILRATSGFSVPIAESHSLIRLSSSLAPR